jgi:hypothetical protein
MMGKTTSVVDYQVLLDGEITLDASTAFRETTFEFTVPSDFVMTSSSRQPILAFKARPFENSDFKVFLNHREVLSTDLDASHTRLYWEVISASTAFPEGASFNNPAPLRFILNSGRMRISDMVIWYQVDRPWE